MGEEIFLANENLKQNQFTSEIFFLLHAYEKLGFYFLALPFKAVINKDGKLEFKQYFVHQLICFILHVSSLYFGITNLWGTLKKTTFAHGSTSLFELSLFLILISATSIFICNCWWRKPNPYKSLLRTTFSYIDKSSMNSFRQTLFVVFTTIIQLTLAMCPEVLTYVSNFNISNTTSTASAVFDVLYFGQAVYFQILFHMSVIIPTCLGNYCMYLIGKRFNEVASVEYIMLTSPSTKMNLKCLDQLMNYFLQVKFLVRELNMALGKMMLMLSFSVLPTLGFGLSSIISDSYVPWVEYMRTMYICLMFYIYILLSAKGRSDIMRFPEIAYEQIWRNGKHASNNEELIQLIAITQYVNTTKIGFGGYPFFIIDYKYIGAMTSALITYTVIMLQFRDNK